MLPAVARVRRRSEFARAIREGRRAGRSRLVVHLHLEFCLDPDRPARAGFLVGRAVGGAVVRNRVRRRLRHLVRGRLDVLPRGSLLVVRALPAAADASVAELADDLDSALRRLGATAAPSVS